jgi:cell wall-associated NlpC family hydrolase
MFRAKETFRIGCLLAALCHLGGNELLAQGRGVDFSYGRWWRDGSGAAELFSLTYSRPWFGPVGLGFSGTFLDDRTALEDRTQAGGELQLTVGRQGGGLYGIGAGGLAMRTDGGSLNAVWSAGVGYEWRPLSFFSLGAEGRYRVEKDEWTKGFWMYDAARDRKGWQLQARMAFHFGGRAPAATPRPVATSTTTQTTPEFAPPSESDMTALAMSSGASSSSATAAASVVQTAIDVMGTPYEWGGTDENGFDCSGLIQYAYGENGIILPRVSRDQARTGKFVNPRVPDLQPGDILGFSVERTSRITHVGLYIGDGQFIHSSSRGVSISSLIATDANSRWWQHRWVVARRVI